MIIEIAPFNRECSYLVWTIFFLSTESHTAGGQPSTRHLTVLSAPRDVDPAGRMVDCVLPIVRFSASDLINIGGGSVHWRVCC